MLRLLAIMCRPVAHVTADEDEGEDEDEDDEHEDEATLKLKALKLHLQPDRWAAARIIRELGTCILRTYVSG